VVCECLGSVVNMYGVLKNCESVIVVCEYNGSVVVVYGINIKRMSVVMERRVKLRGESSGEEGIIRWSGVLV
jgi:hypothetical protein